MREAKMESFSRREASLIRAIVAGERDPEVLAAYRDVRCHSSIETIRAALTGNDRDEHIFALTQSLDFYDAYQAKIAECDDKLGAPAGVLTSRAATSAPLPKARFRQKPVGAPTFDVRAALYGVLGVDLTQIHGIGPSLALKLIAECRTDLKAGRARSTSPHGSALRPATRSQAESCCRHGHGDLQVGRRLCCGWRRSRWTQRHGAGGILSTAVVPYRQTEGGDCHRTQDRSDLL
jgi:hypothetical protein